MNSIRGEAPLNLADGRELTLVADMEALIKAEATYGKPLAQLMTDSLNGFIGARRAMLYGLLHTFQPGLTPRDAADILQTDGDAAWAAFEKAITIAFPEQNAGDSEPEGKEAANPPGKRSGRSGAKRG